MNNNEEVEFMERAYELLAPVGNNEALKAAVQNGADAVYLSGKAFGARQFAGNFTSEELIDAVRYCHIRGVSVYVTVNTLIFNEEMDSLKSYLEFLYINDVDAVILQDMGVLQYIRSVYPDWSIHCSTQMSTQTVADIEFLEKEGVQRVVLGREMSLEMIRKAKEKTKLQLEVFVHGALCISVSGQCLMSSMIGGRSGNRGRCAQPCRQKYTIVQGDNKVSFNSNGEKYLLSPKDLCTLEDIQSIVKAGVYSFKIEGRMKSPEYVATTVRAYRGMLDTMETGIKTNVLLKKEELRVFNRGFTKGHLLGDSGKSLMNPFYPGNQGCFLGTVTGYDEKKQKATLMLRESLNQNDEIQLRRNGETVGGRVEKLEVNGTLVKHCASGKICTVNFKHSCNLGEKIFKTYDDMYMKSVRDTYHKEMLTIPVRVEVIIEYGKSVSGIISDGMNEAEVSVGVFPEKAVNRGLTEEKVILQISKLGGTPFQMKEVKVCLEPKLSVSMSVLNQLRRNLVEALVQKRKKRYIRNTSFKETELKPKKGGLLQDSSVASIQLSCSITSLEQLEALIEMKVGAEIQNIYFRDPHMLEAAMELVWKHGFEGKLIPEIFKLSTDEELLRHRDQIQKLGIDTVLIQNPGHFNVFESFIKIGDQSLNVVNDDSYAFYQNLSLQRITLSPELNLKQIQCMNLSPNQTEIIGYGFLPVMALKHCLLSDARNCEKKNGLCKKGQFYIEDRKSECFPIQPRFSCYTDIHNAKKIHLIENINDLRNAGVGMFRLHFLHENKAETASILRLYLNISKGIVRPQDEGVLERLKEEGVTKGHLFRGVE